MSKRKSGVCPCVRRERKRERRSLEKAKAEKKKTVTIGTVEHASISLFLLFFTHSHGPCIIMIHLISVFEIPHILDSICGYLALRHLAVCVRVSKPWSSHFLPALYRSLYFSTKVELRHIAPKNFKLIQTITTATLSEPLWDDYETYSLPNIKELQLHWCLINYVDTERCIPKAMSF